MNPVRLYVFGAALSVGIAVVANVLTPGRLTTVAATFAILAPLATILVVDRLTTRRDVYDLREEILAGIRDAGTASGQVISLGSGDAWVRYIERNAIGAKAIFNTRLSGYTGLFDAYHGHIDDVIVEAIRLGTDYSFICSRSRLQSVDGLKQRLSARHTGSRSNAGHVRAYSLDTADKPLLQMKIFDYHGGYSEAMVGFVARSARDISQPIFLVRNPDLVEYLRHVFHSYCDDASAKQEFVY